MNHSMRDNIRVCDGFKITNPDQELAYKDLSDADIMKHIIKSGAIGFVKTSIFKDEANPTKVFGTPNLVLLSGREFLAQKLADVPQSSSVDHRSYKIRYFGYGSGGAQDGNGTEPNKIGPFDDDTGLKKPGHFSTGATDANTMFKYIHNGYLKNIRSDNGYNRGRNSYYK